MRGLPLYSPATHLHGFCSLPNLRGYYIKKILLAKVYQTGFMTMLVPFAERQIIKMKVLNFGSLNLDRVYQLDHIVLPGETISSTRYDVNCGGKGLNQSIALSKAGVNVYHAGKIGEDGLILKNMLDSCGVNTEFIEISNETSGHAIIQVDSEGQNSIVLFGGANKTISQKQIIHTLDSFGKDDILVLQNEINSLDEIIRLAYQKGMRIAFNPSPCNSTIKSLPLECISWLFINETEGKELTSKKKPDEIISELLKKYPSCAIILTLGSEGAYYADGKQIVAQKTFDVDVVDTTAAGDTFTGYFLSGVIQNLEVSEILTIASAASALAVSVDGAANSIPEETVVKQFLTQYQ